MVLNLDLSDDLAAQLALHEHQISQSLEMGLREMNASTPEEVLALRSAPALEERIRDLLEKNRTEGLTPDEEREWERYEDLEHLVRMAKVKAKAKLREA